MCIICSRAMEALRNLGAKGARKKGVRGKRRREKKKSVNSARRAGCNRLSLSLASPFFFPKGVPYHDGS